MTNFSSLAQVCGQYGSVGFPDSLYGTSGSSAGSPSAATAIAAAAAASSAAAVAAAAAAAAGSSSSPACSDGAIASFGFTQVSQFHQPIRTYTKS